MAGESIRSKVLSTLRGFLDSTGRNKVLFRDSSNLISDVGLTSDEGIDFAIELGATLQFDLPLELNPFVHESGTRGRRVSELVKVIERLMVKAKSAV